MIEKPEHLNRLTNRQLRKAFPDEQFTPEGLAMFIRLVNASYISMEDERLLNERAMRISQKELELINKELQVKNEFLDSFNHGLAHDVKNHTANILGLITMLRKYLLRENEEMVDSIIDKLSLSTNQLTSIVQGFLYLSRYENKTDDHYTIIHPEDLRTSIQLEIQYLLLKRNVSLTYDFRCENLFYSIHILKIIFVNLVSNAIKFSKPKEPGTVRAVLTHDDTSIQLIVQDTGIGMDLSATDKKFIKLFHQKENGGLVKGHGVGLFVIKKIIDRNHGELTVESIPDRGTTIRIRLPIQTNAHTE